MPQISIIKKSDIQEARRFDTEFFKPEYLENEKNMEKIKQIKEIMQKTKSNKKIKIIEK